MAFYHTYRPQNFNDIKLTQAKVAETLVLSLLKRKLADGSVGEGSLSHAYLFTGTHGTGKTTTARILAKAVNCEKFSTRPEFKDSYKEGELQKLIEKFPIPCDACDACKHISAGTFLDVIEMDAASNRGIDEIRELKDKIRLAPMNANKKVYIIDEVHMLTTEAFNALLKTLEEPPAHSLFILCTTELQKVPQTIQSRCTKLVFQKPGLTEIKTLLNYISQKEKITVEDEALIALARASGGAFRDAVKLLEMASVQFSPITATNVSQLTLGSNRINSLQIISFIRSGNVKELLTLVTTYEHGGAHFNELLKTLLSDARELLFYKAGAMSLADVDCLTGVSSTDLTSYNSLLDTGFLSEYIDNLVKALGQEKSTPIPSLPLEILFLKMSGAIVHTVSPVPAVAPAKKVEVSRESPPVIEKPVKTVERIEKSEVVSVDDVVIAMDEVVEIQSEPVLPSSVIPTVTNEELTIELVQERWGEVVKLLKKYHASMSVMIAKCKPLRLDGKSLIIETQNSFNKDMIESPKNRPIIEQAIYELLAAQVRVKTVLANTKLTQKNVENIQPVSDDDLVNVAKEIFGS